jgi:eukaryotic-like serine/threonine-protein kinase
MGIVYKARHPRLNRFVAVKMLSTGAYSGPHERARFQREAVAGLRFGLLQLSFDGTRSPGRIPRLPHIGHCEMTSSAWV